MDRLLLWIRLDLIPNILDLNWWHVWYFVECYFYLSITESFVLGNDAGSSSKNAIYWFLDFLSWNFWIFCPKSRQIMGRAFTVKQLNIMIFYWDQLGFILAVLMNKVWRVFLLKRDVIWLSTFCFNIFNLLVSLCS